MSTIKSMKGVVPKRKDEPIQIRGLDQLDALVGRHVMGSVPKVVWEDTYTNFRFDNLPEALEAMRDPYFSAFVPEQSRPSASLREVHEFPAFSSDLPVALSIVEHLSTEERVLTLQFEMERWKASFADDLPASAPDSVAVAICLAALRSRGIEVSFGHEGKVGLGVDRCIC